MQTKKSMLIYFLVTSVSFSFLNTAIKKKKITKEDAPHGFLSDTILFVYAFCGLITPFVVFFPLG